MMHRRLIEGWGMVMSLVGAGKCLVSTKDGQCCGKLDLYAHSFEYENVPGKG